MNSRPSPILLIVVGIVVLALIFTFLRRNILRGDERVGDVASLPTQSAAPRAISTDSADHIVQAGETLGAIAQQYGVTLAELTAANAISNPNFVKVGTRLVIPNAAGGASVVNSAELTLSNLIPDSELVFGPTMQGVSIDSLVPNDSFLRRYREDVEGVQLDGVQIVHLAAERLRVNPRLLLAAIEYRSGWVTLANPAVQTPTVGKSDQAGLYRQLEWVGNLFNRGYYGRDEIDLAQMQLADGTTVAFDKTLSSGTAGVQLWLGALPDTTLDSWQLAISQEPFSFSAAYRSLFGDPFQYADDNFWSPTIAQPALGLPWLSGETWHFTGGPHGGWINGSAWAALDFVTDEAAFGCYESPVWEAAVADGVVTRSDFGAVVLDLDGDGYAGTGWAVVYQHVATQDRVAVGTRLKRGERIGHASCEGGYSTGTHLHIARTYNGRWVSADSPTQPFVLGGWVAAGSGSEYNGTLSKDGVVISAEAARIPANAILNP